MQIWRPAAVFYGKGRAVQFYALLLSQQRFVYIDRTNYEDVISVHSNNRFCHVIAQQKVEGDAAAPEGHSEVGGLRGVWPRHKRFGMSP